MNAINFIKQHGVEKAREVVDGAPDGVMLFEYIPICSGLSYIKIIDGIRYCFNPATNNWFIDNFKAEISFQFNDLKRLVESVDLVGKVGAISQAKAQVKQAHEHGYLTMSIHVEINGSMCIGCLYIDTLEKAIADYESIYGGEHV